MLALLFLLQLFMGSRCFFFFFSHQFYASQARAELNFGSSLYLFLPYITDLYMFALCSNIEDISRDAGSVDIEEDTLDSMF